MDVATERGLSDDQEYAAQHGLPRVVWRRGPLRLVEYLEEEVGLLVLGLERRDGTDYLGQERWQAVRRDGAPHDGWASCSREWEDAFWALARCLFAPAASEAGSLELAPLIFDEEQLEDEGDTAS